MKKKIFLGVIFSIITIALVFSYQYVVDGLEGETTETVEQSVNTDNVDTNNDVYDRFEGMTTRNDDKGVPVLCYHSVADDESTNGPITLSKSKLRQHLSVLKEEGYVTLTIGELEDYLHNNKPIPEKSVVLTFDDGYKDNYVNAFPILKEFNMKATFFVITDYSLNGNNDRFINEKEIKELSDWGIDIQSHTVSHTELATLSFDKQVDELKKSKEKLEGITSKKVNATAYPVGSYNDDTFKALDEAGYKMGFTIERGLADRNDNKGKLNRICVDYTYGSKDIKKVLTKFKN